jgi:hypothetical protein
MRAAAAQGRLPAVEISLFGPRGLNPGSLGSSGAPLAPPTPYTIITIITREDGAGRGKGREPLLGNRAQDRPGECHGVKRHPFEGKRARRGPGDRLAPRPRVRERDPGVPRTGAPVALSHCVDGPK